MAPIARKMNKMLTTAETTARSLRITFIADCGTLTLRQATLNNNTNLVAVRTS